MDWSGVDYLWIIAVCALILTAPIHFPWKKHTNLHRGWSNNEYILSIFASFILKSYKTSIMSSTNVQHLGLNWQSIMLTISWNLDKNLKFTLFITSSNIRMSKITFIYIYIHTAIHRLLSDSIQTFLLSARTLNTSSTNQHIKTSTCLTRGNSWQMSTFLACV